ncbi:MAG: hypothetical protein J6V54_07310 [Bacteroidales bacterium]|nr:hypothetical protein [Bacteroidales bacterium]
MKKVFLLFMIVCIFGIRASGQSSIADKSVGDTLFRIRYDNQSFYIMNSDVTARDGDVFYLTDAKYLELDKLHVVLGHHVSLSEKTPTGTWIYINVFHPWDSFLPSGGVRVLIIPFIEDTDGSDLPYYKIVFKKGNTGYFRLDTL